MTIDNDKVSQGVVVTEPVQDEEEEIAQNGGETSEPKLSKKGMKKAAKRQAFEAQKKERRVREKEMRKEKKKALHQKRLAGEMDDVEKALYEQRANKRRKIEPFGGKVVIDLGFDEKMAEKEVNSLTSQLAYTYSGNRNVSYPFTLLYTSIGGRTRDRLESMNDAAYKRWTHTEWWEEGYDRLWTEEGKAEVKEKVVYLTADSDHELEELKPGEIYILGGIVDRNRYKNLCLDKANESGIRHARLPIGRYVASLPTRKVLTVNQVFEIMLKWVETKDWESAFYSIIPKRKFQEKGKKSDKGGTDAAVVPLLEDIDEKDQAGDGSGEPIEGEDELAATT